MNYELSLDREIGYSMIVTYNENIVWPMHIHRHIELVIVTEGTLSMMIRSEKYRIPAGNILLIEPFTPHAFLEEEPNHCFILEHDLSLVSHITEHLSKYSVKNRMIPLDENIFRYVLSEIGIHKYKQLIGLSLSYAVLMPIYHEFMKKTEFVDKTDVPDDLYIKTLSYIIAHLNENLSLDVIAGHLQIRPETLSRKFREKAGMPLHEYINRLRIYASCGLLSRGMTAANASVCVGLNTVRTFNRLFQQFMKITPTEYLANRSRYEHFTILDISCITDKYPTESSAFDYYHDPGDGKISDGETE